MRSKNTASIRAGVCAQDDLSPELQAITRIIGALQAMQNMRLPAALGGSKPEEAEARTSRAVAGAGGAQSRGRGSGEAEDAEADKSSGKEGAGGSRGRDMGGSMAGDMEDGRDSEACAGGKDGSETRGSKAGDAAAGQSSSKGAEEGASKAEVAETGQSGGKGAGGGEAREEGAGGEEAAESAQVDEKSPESYEPCMPGRVLYIERCVSACPLTMFVQSPREMRLPCMHCPQGFIVYHHTKAPHLVQHTLCWLKSWQQAHKLGGSRRTCARA